ncbi:hypothetical protein V1511DRAFT_485533 [Dipodascopsis uninucleata]
MLSQRIQDSLRLRRKKNHMAIAEMSASEPTPLTLSETDLSVSASLSSSTDSSITSSIPTTISHEPSFPIEQKSIFISENTDIISSCIFEINDPDLSLTVPSPVTDDTSSTSQLQRDCQNLRGPSKLLSLFGSRSGSLRNKLPNRSRRSSVIASQLLYMNSDSTVHREYAKPNADDNTNGHILSTITRDETNTDCNFSQQVPSNLGASHPHTVSGFNELLTAAHERIGCTQYLTEYLSMMETLQMRAQRRHDRRKRYSLYYYPNSIAVLYPEHKFDSSFYDQLQLDQEETEDEDCAGFLQPPSLRFVAGCKTFRDYLYQFCGGAFSNTTMGGITAKEIDSILESKCSPALIGSLSKQKVLIDGTILNDTSNSKSKLDKFRTKQHTRRFGTRRQKHIQSDSINYRRSIGRPRELCKGLGTSYTRDRNYIWRQRAISIFNPDAVIEEVEEDMSCNEDGLLEYLGCGNWIQEKKGNYNWNVKRRARSSRGNTSGFRRKMEQLMNNFRIQLIPTAVVTTAASTR